MAQKKENRACSAEVVHLTPKASTDILSGDVVVLARRSDPRSLAAIGPAGRIRPIGAAWEGQWVAGVCDDVFTTTVVGATDYAAPDADNNVRVMRDGQFYLALTATAGKAGDLVVYSSGAAGAQLFAINNKLGGFAVAKVVNDFSGASANDLQLCELITVPLGGPSIHSWLENRVLDGCKVSVAAAPTTQVACGNLLVGTVPAMNAVIIQNKYFRIARNASLVIGVASAAASSFRSKWIVARSGGFGVRSGSSTKAALASYTAAGVTIGLLAPTTMTAGEIPIALLIQFSAATQSLARIKNVRAPGIVPNVGSWGV